jgi:hypothetical protein
MILQRGAVTPDWLALREPADAAARSTELAARLAAALPASRTPLHVHDLGGGSGALGRWLAPRLPGRQHWVVHDRDEHLLALAVAAPPAAASDGAPVTVEARPSDIARLDRTDLAGADLVAASAVLDLLSEEELAAMLAACAPQRCPILLTLSVAGRVVLIPGDPLDGAVTAAFNAHQRRMTPVGRLLGPHAVAAAVSRLRTTSSAVLVRRSPWRLDAGHAELTAEWLRGWVVAAGAQDPALADALDAYRDRRLAQLVAGELAVTVDHVDLLALP